MPGERILIVDDEKVLRTSLNLELTDEGYEVHEADSGETALAAAAEFCPHVVLLDLRLPGMDGLSVLAALKAADDTTAVIIMTAFGDTGTTVEAIKQGAFHFINKPFELDELKGMVRQAADSLARRRDYAYLKYQQRKFYRYCDLVGQSEGMKRVYEQIDVLAGTDDITILIRGESGTGKELVAGAIHYKSRRSQAPFVEINCASLPESLLESELFGYEKGAFTDARQQKKGLFEMGDGGTLFLDEIGEMPLSIQAKLLRFLEKKQFKRLGSGRDLKVDARIIAATNRDLEAAIHKGLFREDLYYRLNVVTIEVPPLRERQEDILLLADYFLNQYSRDMGREPMTLSPTVREIFRTHPWRGNVRELKNTIERAVIFGSQAVLDNSLLPPQMVSRAGLPPVDAGICAAIPENLDLDRQVALFERQVIFKALERTDGNKSRAAAELGVSRFSLNRRMERLSRLMRPPVDGGETTA